MNLIELFDQFSKFFFYVRSMYNPTKLYILLLLNSDIHLPAVINMIKTSENYWGNIFYFWSPKSLLYCFFMKITWERSNDLRLSRQITICTFNYIFNCRIVWNIAVINHNGSTNLICAASLHMPQHLEAARNPRHFTNMHSPVHILARAPGRTSS